MSRAAVPFELRPCTADDLALTYAITEQAMRGYVEQTWGAWHDEEQQLKHRESYTPATHRLVIVDGQVAGLVATEDEGDMLWLVKLYLLAEQRNRGLGSALLQQLQRDARARGQRMRLRVLRANIGARRLYERHGFVVSGETAERWFMVWEA